LGVRIAGWKKKKTHSAVVHHRTEVQNRGITGQTRPMGLKEERLSSLGGRQQQNRGERLLNTTAWVVEKGTAEKTSVFHTFADGDSAKKNWGFGVHNN